MSWLGDLWDQGTKQLGNNWDAGMNWLDGPARPDFANAAKKTSDASQQAVNAQTQANRPNINTPFGFENWSQGPDGQWTLNQGYNPQMQGSIDELMKQMMAGFGQPMGNADDARKKASDSIYSQETSRLDPAWQARESGMRTQLMNQGLDPSSEAFKTEMDNFGRSRNDAYQGAMNQSITGGGEEAQRQMAMAMALRNQPLQELQGLMGFGAMPGFNQAGQGQGTNYLGALGMQSGWDQNQHDQQMKMITQMLSAIPGLGMAAGGM